MIIVGSPSSNQMVRSKSAVWTKVLILAFILVGCGHRQPDDDAYWGSVATAMKQGKGGHILDVYK